VASVADGEPVGLTVGSFFSVSLDPPLVGFCVGTGSTTWPAIARSGVFAVSVLAHDQAEVCRTLATKEPNKFATLAWSAAPTTGAPLINQALAHIECEIETRHQAGDHWIVVGRVLHLSVHRDDAGPLSFWRGRFGRHQSVDPDELMPWTA
jgi:3-hydroxy-9,10-secoandrosta-1,3,5(10)-triene-9,17-dione monooxygenase reductase component